jgi:hypothetical protein
MIGMPLGDHTGTEGPNFIMMINDAQTPTASSHH